MAWPNSLPGKDVVVDRAKPTDHAHEDVYVAVRDAFAAAVRRLEDQTRKRRDRIKLTPDRRLSKADKLEAAHRFQKGLIAAMRPKACSALSKSVSA